MSLVESIRTYQTEPIQGVKYPVSQGVYSATVGLSVSVEGREVDTLRFETGKHSTQIVRFSSLKRS